MEARGNSRRTAVLEHIGMLAREQPFASRGDLRPDDHGRQMDENLLQGASLDKRLYLPNVAAVWGGNKRWQRLHREFQSYPKPIKIGGGILIVVLIILTVIAASHFGAAYSHLPR